MYLRFIDFIIVIIVAAFVTTVTVRIYSIGSLVDLSYLIDYYVNFEEIELQYCFIFTY